MLLRILCGEFRNKATVSCVIVGIAQSSNKSKVIYETDGITGEVSARSVNSINPYLNDKKLVIVKRQTNPLCEQYRMGFGNMPYDENNLLLTPDELTELNLSEQERRVLIKRIYGSKEFCQGITRYCIWIPNEEVLNIALKNRKIAERIHRVKEFREGSTDAGGRKLASRPHQFREMNLCKHYSIIVPRVTKESRPYLPCGIVSGVVSDSAFSILDGPLWNLAIIASRLHLVWVKAVCGQLETRFRYSNTLGWHTFPIPKLTEKNKVDLTQAAEKILEVRESYFPATIADLYDNMPDDLRTAHEWNDEVVERIFISRKFKNDSERLEKLYEMYANLTKKATK